MGNNSKVVKRTTTPPRSLSNAPHTGRVDFFISYTGIDAEWAKWIAWELARAGFTYRIQAEHIPPGSRFINMMRQWLDIADHLIAVLSPAYFESPFASLEINSAIAQDPLGQARRVIPVRVVTCTVPAIFRDLVYIDLAAERDEQKARRALIAGVRAAMVGSSPPDMTVRERPKFPPDAAPALEKDARPELRKVDDEGPVRIQFFACDVGRGLDLKGQYDRLRKVLTASRFAAQFELKPEFDVTNVNLFEKLNSYQPNVVHISGNQSGGDVLLPAVGGGEIVVPDMALAGLLSCLGRRVRLAVIDTCKSYACAKRISEVVHYAIGVDDDIFDAEATLFYETFYRAVAAGQSIRDGHGQAVAALQFGRVPQKRIPQLCIKEGHDASKAYFAVEDGRH